MAAGLLARSPAAHPSPVSAVRETIVAGLDDPSTYPVLSEATVRAMAVIGGEDSSVNQLAAIVRPDAILTTAVIRTANSWVYRGTVPVNSVPAAILRLGQRECGRVVAAVGIQSLYHRLGPEARKGCEALHRHSVFVACLASSLNKAVGLGLEAAFTAGLLHDVGRIILCGKMPGRFREAGGFGNREDAGTIRRERELFGIDHPAVGYRFAVRNELPEPVVRAILNHHRPDEERFHPELVALVGVADVIANHVQREHNLAGLDLTDDPGYERLVGAGVEEARVRVKLPGVVKDAIRAARGMLRAAG